MNTLSFANVDAVIEGRNILICLGVLSVWIWTLAVVCIIDIASAGRSSASSLVQQHQRYCCGLACANLRKRLRHRLTRVHRDNLLRRSNAHITTILLLSSLAPLLGLLGTIEGMVDNFTVIARVGIADSSQLTAGISKALITTQGGLLVAIPGLIAGGVLYRKLGKLKNRLSLVGTAKGAR